MCHGLSKSRSDKIFAECEVWSLELSAERRPFESFNFHMCVCCWLRVQWFHWALTPTLTSSQWLLLAGCVYKGRLLWIKTDQDVPQSKWLYGKSSDWIWIFFLWIIDWHLLSGWVSGSILSSGYCLYWVSHILLGSVWV